MPFPKNVVCQLAKFTQTLHTAKFFSLPQSTVPEGYLTSLFPTAEGQPLLSPQLAFGEERDKSISFPWFPSSPAVDHNQGPPD